MPESEKQGDANEFYQMPEIPEKDYRNGITEITHSVNGFGFDLYRHLNEDENLFFSPYSISCALAMTYAGARGNTAKEMSDVLYFNTNQAVFHHNYRLFNDSLLNLDKVKSIELNVANALWAQEDYDFLKEYMEFIEKSYDAAIQNMDFKESSNRENARKKINNWVEEKTKDKIKDLIQPGILTPLTRMILTNAIYFKGKWMFPFDKGKTHTSIFHIDPDKSTSTDFMNQTKQVGYYEDNEVQAIELPYEGKKITMVIILPKTINGWKQQGKALNQKKLNHVLSNMTRTEVVMAIPKFTKESSFSLSKKLTEMGMTDAFTDDADFSGMTGNKELMIDEVLHKSYIEVNEAGTEAAAATAVIMALKSEYIENPVRFIADHPFIYMIMDKKTGGMIFLGRFVNPEKK